MVSHISSLKTSVLCNESCCAIRMSQAHGIGSTINVEQKLVLDCQPVTASTMDYAWSRKLEAEATVGLVQLQLQL